MSKIKIIIQVIVRTIFAQEGSARFVCLVTVIISDIFESIPSIETSIW